MGLEHLSLQLFASLLTATLWNSVTVGIRSVTWIWTPVSHLYPYDDSLEERACLGHCVQFTNGETEAPKNEITSPGHPSWQTSESSQIAWENQGRELQPLSPNCWVSGCPTGARTRHPAPAYSLFCGASLSAWSLMSMVETNPCNRSKPDLIILKTWAVIFVASFLACLVCQELCTSHLISYTLVL